MSARNAAMTAPSATTLGFREVVEPMLAQQLIQARVERVAGGRTICGHYPHSRLSVAFAYAIAMRGIVVRCGRA